VDTVFASLLQFLIACLILAGAEAIYVLLGFGAGMVAVGLLALVVPELRDVVVILLLVNLPAEAWVVASSWRRISWRGVLLVMAGVAAGIPLGSWLLSTADLGLLLTLLGVVLAVAGVVFLLTPNRPLRPVPVWTAPPVGLLSGVLTGLFGTGGPPLIFYSQLKGDDKATFRASLMAVFLLMTVVRIPSYAVFGLITAPRIWSSLALVPAAMLGAFLGNRIHLRIDEATFRGQLASAIHRDEVARLTLRYTAGFFNRVCLFVVHRGSVLGWTGRGHGIVVDDLQSFSVPLDQESLFSDFRSGAGYHLGPIPDERANQALLHVLGEPKPLSALLLPICVRDRAVAFLLADNPNEQVVAPVEHLVSVLAAVGLAIEVLILRKKISG
jgi:hypothetical protein